MSNNILRLQPSGYLKIPTPKFSILLAQSVTPQCLMGMILREEKWQLHESTRSPAGSCATSLSVVACPCAFHFLSSVQTRDFTIFCCFPL